MESSSVQVNQIVAKLPRVDIPVLGSMLSSRPTSHSQLNAVHARPAPHRRAANSDRHDGDRGIYDGIKFIP